MTVEHRGPGQPGPSAPLLQVDDLQVEFRTRNGRREGRQRRQLQRQRGRDPRHARRVRLRQERDRPGHHGHPRHRRPGTSPAGRSATAAWTCSSCPRSERRQSAANKIAMIFQDALSALNPVFTVGFQIGELFRMHRGMSRADAKKRAIELLDLVKIPAAEAAGQRLPAPVLRRHAAARHDRDGAGARPGGAHRRRADHRARRHGAGPDHGAARRTAARNGTWA